MDGFKLKGLTCRHCGGKLKAGDNSCPHCGIPLPPGFAASTQRKFLWWFIVLVIFCAVIIIWLPPDWTGLGK